MYLTNNLINGIEEFLNDEEVMNFFEIKGYKPIYKSILGKNTVYLENAKNKNIEIMEIKADRNNKDRIRFKGSTWAFSINRNNDGKYYLDHLLIGNVEKNEYTFIMRHNIDENNNSEFIVKLVDNNNRKHIYHIKDNCIHMTRETLPPKEFECKDNKFVEKQSKESRKKIEEFFYFKGKDDKPALLDYSEEYQDACKQEFIILENSYISITSFIARRIPFLSTCINEKADDNVKPYEIKRKTDVTKPYERGKNNRDNNKIYKFTRKKNN